MLPNRDCTPAIPENSSPLVVRYIRDAYANNNPQPFSTSTELRRLHLPVAIVRYGLVFQCSLADSSKIQSRGFDMIFRTSATEAGVLADTYDSACFFINVCMYRQMSMLSNERWLTCFSPVRIPRAVASKDAPLTCWVMRTFWIRSFSRGWSKTMRSWRSPRP